MFFGAYQTTPKRRHLLKAAKLHPNNVLRLGRFLGLRIDGMSAGQVARLIAWRLSR